jgi:hypothetical protein
MAEAFVKTFKRDYVLSADLSSARAVMAQLPEWFEDYNENARHKGLKINGCTYGSGAEYAYWLSAKEALTDQGPH